MAGRAVKRKQVPKKLFPCPNCPLAAYQDTPSCKFELAQSGGPKEILAILKGRIPVKRTRIAEMPPACRF